MEWRLVVKIKGTECTETGIACGNDTDRKEVIAF